MKAKVLFIALFVLNIFQVSAQSVDEVTLIVSSDGATKEEATLKALRNAIEQAYGAFVSANTQILNDELVKDEIVTVSNGNIKKYEELSHSMLPNGNQFVTLNATVSISKLVSFAQSKGASAELAGETFAMNLKMDELYKENFNKAIENIVFQFVTLVNDLPNLFDCELSLREPRLDFNNNNLVSVVGYIIAKENSNTLLIRQFIANSLIPLLINNKKSTSNYRNVNVKVPFSWSYKYNKNNEKEKGFVSGLYDPWSYQYFREYSDGPNRDTIRLDFAFYETILNYIAKMKFGIKTNVGDFFDMKMEYTGIADDFSFDSLSKLRDDSSGIDCYGRKLDFIGNHDNNGVSFYANISDELFDEIIPNILYSKSDVTETSDGLQIKIREKESPRLARSMRFLIEIPKDRIGSYSKFEVVNIKE